MPLRDHFHGPLADEVSWSSFHANWATKLADNLSDLLPAGFRVEEHVHAGPNVEIDVATFERTGLVVPTSANGPSAAVVTAPAYAPPIPDLTFPAAFPDSFEVHVFRARGGKTLVAAIELISPRNKDRPADRRVFAGKCASYLAQGISLILVDIVTERRANLHNETMRLMEANPDLELPANSALYAVAYRPVRRGERDEIDLWRRQLALGEPLPTLPLRLTGDLFVPVDLEATYSEALRRRHLA